MGSRGLQSVVVAVVLTAGGCPFGPGRGGDLPAPAPTPAGEAAPNAAAVTFTRDVAPILYANCATCHRRGEVAPFALLTYAEAKRHARQLARLTGDRVMPPWKADAGAEVFR